MRGHWCFSSFFPPSPSIRVLHMRHLLNFSFQLLYDHILLHFRKWFLRSLPIERMALMLLLLLLLFQLFAPHIVQIPIGVSVVHAISMSVYVAFHRQYSLLLFISVWPFCTKQTHRIYIRVRYSQFSVCTMHRILFVLFSIVYVFSVLLLCQSLVYVCHTHSSVHDRYDAAQSIWQSE